MTGRKRVYKYDREGPRPEADLLAESRDGLTVEALDSFLGVISSSRWHTKGDLYFSGDRRDLSILDLQLSLRPESLEFLVSGGMIETRDIPEDLTKQLTNAKSYAIRAQSLEEDWSKLFKYSFWFQPGRKKLDRIGQEWRESGEAARMAYQTYVDKTISSGIPSHVVFDNARKALWLTLKGRTAKAELEFLDTREKGKVKYGTEEYKKTLQEVGVIDYTLVFTNMLQRLNSISEKAKSYAESCAINYDSRGSGSGMGDIFETYFVLRFRSSNGGFFYQDSVEGSMGGYSPTFENERKYQPLTPEEMNLIMLERSDMDSLKGDVEGRQTVGSFFTAFQGGRAYIPEGIVNEIRAKFPELGIEHIHAV